MSHLPASRKRLLRFSMVAALCGAAVLCCYAADSGKEWAVHDLNRPKPGVITPGVESTQERAGQPPSDAVVLFDGKDLSKWQDGEKWKVENGYMEAAGGSISTKDTFGDCQLHVEWMAPAVATGASQDRGNSGVKLMGRYEVQVLDSFRNETYADGQAGALYGQHPPLVNASRPPGQWQTYDIIFHGPRFGADGNLLRPARVTVLHNGVLIQDNAELRGTTGHKSAGKYTAHPEKLPLGLQFHGHPVRYRNLWLRPLPDEGEAHKAAAAAK